MTNQDELSQAEINELQPDDVAVLPDEALEKLENAETPDQVDEVIKEAQGESVEPATGVMEQAADQQATEATNSQANVEAAGEQENGQSENIPVI